METRAHYVLIGLFTVAVFTGAMWFMLWMAKAGPNEDIAHYDVVFRESVTGLSIGSRVLYSGIHVGTVERIIIDPDDPRQVIARIRVAGTTPVTQDTRAELILANITGASEIQLIGGAVGSAPLVREDGGVPRIFAEPSRLARLSGSLSRLLEDFSVLIENSNRILSEENMQHLTRSLEHLSQFSAVLAGQGEVLVTDGARTMASLQSAAATLDRLLDENEEALAGGMQGLTGLGPALEELRRTMTTLREVTRRFDEDPGGYLLSREPVREFRP